MLPHAGPEVGSLATSALDVCRRRPGLRLILPHGALTDPLGVLVPPGRVLSASDLPYRTPLSSTMATIRCAWRVGLDADQIASVIGGQMARLVDDRPPRDLGPPSSSEPSPPSPLLEVMSTAC
ncbi:MAG: hypothetical protein ACJ715_11655 [Ornithinibacter sp.]